MIISKNYNLYLLAIALISCANIFAIKVNGEELSEEIKLGDPLVFLCSNDRYLINISIKDANINIQSDVLNHVEKINENFNNLKEKKGGIKFTSRELDLSSGADMIQEEYFATAREKILLKAGNELNLVSSILTSPEIMLFCKKMNLSNCYIDADTLVIESGSFESLCQKIVFKFKKNIQVPYLIEGQIDFENDQVHNLSIVGVDRIEVFFSPKVLEAK